MSEAINEMIPDPLIFSDAAANKVKQLIAEEENDDLRLRVFISGGGCFRFFSTVLPLMKMSKTVILL